MIAFSKISSRSSRDCALLLLIAAWIILPPLATPGRFVQEAVAAENPPAVVADELASYRRIVKAGPANRADARLLHHVLDTRNHELAPIFRATDLNRVAAALDQLRARHRQRPRQRFLQVFPQETLNDSTEHLDIAATACVAHGFSFKEYPPHALSFPIHWQADPFHDRGWRFQLNAWHFLDPHLLLYERKNDPAYLAFPVRIAVDWSRQHITDAKQHNFAWYDMAAGRRAAQLAKILDAALGDPTVQVTDDDLIQLLVAARIHVQYLSDASQIAWHSNHGLAQLAGLLALTRAVPELSGATAGHAFAQTSLKKLFNKHFTAEGIHKEHSPVYHVELVNFLWHLLDTGLIADAQLQKLFESASDNIISYVHPNGNLSRVGDGDTNLAAERILFPPSPQLEFVLSHGQRGVPPDTAFQIFRKSGYAAFRSDWQETPQPDGSYLFFAAGFHSRTHKQADDFTFEWADLGQELLIDSGKFRYDNKSPERQYAISTRAHNTVEIDGQDFSRYRLDAFGSAITAGGTADGAYFVEAEVDRKRFFKTKHRRILVFQPGQWLAVIDQLRSPDPHQFTQWFHFAPELTVNEAVTGFTAPLTVQDKSLQVVPLYGQETLQQTLIRGQHQPSLQGWTSLNYGELTPNHAAGFTTRGRNATFITLLWLGDPRVNLRPGNTVLHEKTDTIHVRWQLPDGEAGFDYRRLKSGGKLTLLNRSPLANRAPGATVR